MLAKHKAAKTMHWLRIVTPPKTNIVRCFNNPLNFVVDEATSPNFVVDEATSPNFVVDEATSPNFVVDEATSPNFVVDEHYMRSVSFCYRARGLNAL